jgi:hypothetical protein
LKNPETKSTNHKLHNNWGTKEMLENIVTNPKKRSMTRDGCCRVKP